MLDFDLALAEIQRLCYLADHHVRQALQARDKRMLQVLSSRFGSLQGAATRAELELKRGRRWTLTCYTCNVSGPENVHIGRECQLCKGMLTYRNLDK